MTLNKSYKSLRRKQDREECEYAFGICMVSNTSCIKNSEYVHECSIRDKKRLEDHIMRMNQINKLTLNPLGEKLREAFDKQI